MAVLDSLIPFAPFFVPVVSGLVGGASLLIRDRREARSSDHHYRRRLEKAQLEIQFLSGWIQAKQLAPTDAPTPDPEPGRWLDECYASVRRAKADTGGRHRTGPVSLRRLLLLGEVSGPARSMRVVYWISLVLFNGALAWWVNALVIGVPGFAHMDGASESEEVASYLALAGVFRGVGRPVGVDGAPGRGGAGAGLPQADRLGGLGGAGAEVAERRAREGGCEGAIGAAGEGERDGRRGRVRGLTRPGPALRPGPCPVVTPPVRPLAGSRRARRRRR